jgi:menaquinone-dependent protoporphyrinogen oxidase
MRVLVLFATVEGHTEKIAGFISRMLQDGGHEVFLSATNQAGYCDPGTVDAAILCAPIHIGRYPSDFVHYIQNWKSSLVDIPNALITSSLAIASDDEEEQSEARAFPDKLAKQTGWKPRKVFNVAGALKYTGYDFFKRWMMRRISASEGGPVDTSKDHELTDWDALAAFVTDFMKSSAKVDA